jgi:hypothetical protein
VLGFLWQPLSTYIKWSNSSYRPTEHTWFEVPSALALRFVGIEIVQKSIDLFIVLLCFGGLLNGHEKHSIVGAECGNNSCPCPQLMDVFMILHLRKKKIFHTPLFRITGNMQHAMKFHATAIFEQVLIVVCLAQPSWAQIG